MSQNARVDWHGDELLKQIYETLPEALFAGGKMLIEAAASKAPRRSGILAKSGYVAIEGKTTYRKRKQYNKQQKPPKGGAVAGFAAFYARQIEFGNKNMAAKPFLRPALDELKERISKEIIETIGRKIK